MLKCTFFSRESLTHFPFCVFCGCLGGQGIWCGCFGSVWALKWQLNALFHNKINEISMWSLTCYFCDGLDTVSKYFLLYYSLFAKNVKLTEAYRPIRDESLADMAVCVYVCVCPAGSDVPLDVSKGYRVTSSLPPADGEKY